MKKLIELRAEATAEEVIVYDWLRSQTGGCVLTSQEIQLQLTEMADIELNTIAETMVRLGYRCVTAEGKFGWEL